MMTPEPRPACVLTCTTAGLTFAIAASRTASILFPVSAGTVACELAPACNAPDAGFVAVAPLLWANCQPENRPVPKTSSRTTARARIAPARGPLPDFLGGRPCGDDGGVGGVGPCP